MYIFHDFEMKTFGLMLITITIFSGLRTHLGNNLGVGTFSKISLFRILV